MANTQYLTVRNSRKTGTKLTIIRFHGGNSAHLTPRVRPVPVQIGRVTLRSPRLRLPVPRLVRRVGRLSVGSRIIILALMPVIGVVANGIAYISGEDEVARAFTTVNRSHELAEASREFKIAIAAKRIAAKDFAAIPHGSLIDVFTESQKLANDSLDAIENSSTYVNTDDIESLRQSLAGLKENFDLLVTVQSLLGFTERNSLRNDLRNAGNAIERAINENMTWLADAEMQKLMLALLDMRHQEAEYRLNPSELSRQEFEVAYRLFSGIFASIDDTPDMKSKLENDVRFYADTFRRWIDISARVHPLRALIDIDSHNMQPQADAVIETAKAAAGKAATALSSPQRGTRAGIIAVGIAMVAFGSV